MRSLKLKILFYLITLLFITIQTVWSSSPIVHIPLTVPDGLYTAEYLQLAERYYKFGKKVLAKQCLDRLKKMQTTAVISNQAFELELELEQSNISPEKQISSAEALLKKYPNSTFALANLISQISGKNKIDPKIESLLLVFLSKNPKEVKALELLSEYYEKRWSPLQASPEKRILYTKQGDILNRLQALDPNSSSLHMQQMNRKPRGTTTYFDKPSYDAALKNSDPLYTVTYLKRDPQFSSEPKTMMKRRFINKSGWELFKLDRWKPFSMGLFDFEFCYEKQTVDGFSDGLYFDGESFRSKSGGNAFGAFFNIFSALRKFNGALDYRSGMCAVQEANHWGFLDKQGNFAIAPKYKYAKSFSEGVAPVCDEMGWHYIDSKGKTVIAGPFERAKEFSEGLAAVYIKGKFGYINKSGKLVIPAIYDDAGSFHEGLAQVIQQETPIKRWHTKYIKPDGSNAFDLTAIQLKYDRTGSSIPNGTLGAHGLPQENALHDRINCSNGRILFFVNGKYGYLDNSGKTVIEPRFDKAETFQEGLAAASINNKFGFIDATGTFSIHPQFNDASNFSDGLARVITASGKNAYIDKLGKTVIDIGEDRGQDFHDGVAVINL